MLVLLITLVLGTSSRHVAITAQPYLNQKAVGHTQVYVCDLNGSHRHKLTHESKGCTNVQWAGTHSLCYIVGGNVIKRLDIRTGLVRTVFRLKGAGAVIESDPVRLQRRATHLPRYVVDSDEIYDIRGVTAVHKHMSIWPVHLPIRTSLGVVDELASGSIVLHSRSSKVVLDQGVEDGLESFLSAWVQGSRFFFVTAHAMSTTGEMYSLSELQGRTCREIAHGNELEADVSKRWLARTTRTPIWHTSEGKFWFSTVGVMDWRAGKLISLSDEYLNATSISLNPDAP